MLRSFDNGDRGEGIIPLPSPPLLGGSGKKRCEGERWAVQIWTRGRKEVKLPAVFAGTWAITTDFPHRRLVFKYGGFLNSYRQISPNPSCELSKCLTLYAGDVHINISCCFNILVYAPKMFCCYSFKFYIVYVYLQLVIFMLRLFILFEE